MAKTKRECTHCGEPFVTSNQSRRDACRECEDEMRFEGVHFTQQPEDPTLYRPRYGFKQFDKE